MNHPFVKSATSAVEFLSGLLGLSSQHARREQMPSVLEMLTICRETGCKLTELECYARAVDAQDVVLLCGGSPELAKQLARRLGFDVEFAFAEELPMLWQVHGGGGGELHFKHGHTETRLDFPTLQNLLGKKLGQERLISIRLRAESDSEHTFIWIPNPGVLNDFADHPTVFELFLRQRLSFAVKDETSEEFAARLRDLGQFFYSLNEEEQSGEQMLAVVDNGLTQLAEVDDEKREELDTALWTWLVPRLIEATARTRLQYELMIDKQTHKLNSTVQMLTEYRRNWVAGIKNQTDSYLQKRVRGDVFETFYDARNPGPEVDTFITALGLSALRQKLLKSMTDRMAEFVAGLSALATKVELRQISLKDVDTRWNPAKLNKLVESAMVKHKTFTEGGGARAGLVGSLTGKSDEIVKARKGQIARATRFVSQEVEQEFAAWCDGLMKQVQNQVRLQLAANLVNQGLPEADTLREAMNGLDRLAAMIAGDSQSGANTSEAIVSNWLNGLSQRRFIPNYVPPETA